MDIHIFSEYNDVFKIIPNNSDKNIYDLNLFFKSKNLGGKYFGILITPKGVEVSKDLVSFTLLEKLYNLGKYENIEEFRNHVVRNGTEKIKGDIYLEFSRIVRGLFSIAPLMAYPYQLSNNQFEAWKAKKMREIIQKECINESENKSIVKKIMI